MNKEFIPYEEALSLKELGFNEPCLASYFHAGKRLHITEYINYGEYTTLAPTFSQAFRWFREKYSLDSFCTQKSLNGNSYYKINKIETDERIKGYSEFTNTYEEAELTCLKKLIEIVKKDNSFK